MRFAIAAVVAALVLTSFTASSFAADEKTKAAAKDILNKYQEAVITVKLVVKTRTIAQGKEIHKQESQIEIPGTVLTAAGLTVVSDSASNPHAALFGGDEGEVKTESETTDVKLLLKDGKEIPAKFVLRDKDLDLGFVMPKEKEQKLAHIPMKKAPVPDVLDDLVFLYRLGKNLNREPALTLGSVEAVVKKPRIFIVPGSSSTEAMGGPVFDLSGKPIGITVMRRGPATSSSDFFSSLRPVILTAEDVMQAAEQALKPVDD